MKNHRGFIFRLGPNRVWRTYSGGRLLDEIEGRQPAVDGPFPEDWIGSTINARNPDSSRPGEGLARVAIDGQETLLSDLIISDPEYFLGPRHVAKFGANPMLLVKYLDSNVRLPIQVHPTVAFSRSRLNSESGKTEAYYILGVRPEVREPFIYMGFQRPPRREELRRMIVEQDMAALQRCFDRIPVKPGDVYLVPGGAPHAIGGGVLMVEVMEPTDYVARVEFNCAGRTIPESARFMGRDVEFALDMFSLEALPLATVQSRWRCGPREFEQGPAMRRESLVDERVTDRFRICRTALSGSGPQRWRAQGFTLLLVVDGQCTITTSREKQSFKKYDRVLIPHGLPEVMIHPHEKVVLLECLPPKA
jgi:mannose-6-phosphate isomerase